MVSKVSSRLKTVSQFSVFRGPRGLGRGAMGLVLNFFGLRITGRTCSPRAVAVFLSSSTAASCSAAWAASMAASLAAVSIAAFEILLSISSLASGCLAYHSLPDGKLGNSGRYGFVAGDLLGDG